MPKRKTKKKKRPDHLAVKAGQHYKVPRAGKPARHVRVLRVRGKNSRQPTAVYVEVTRSGRKKVRAIEAVRWLQWNGKQWDMGPGFTQVELK